MPSRPPSAPNRTALNIACARPDTKRSTAPRWDISSVTAYSWHTPCAATLPGIAVIDLQGIEWYPSRTRRHPLGPSEAFCIYKGRRT